MEYPIRVDSLKGKMMKKKPFFLVLSVMLLVSACIKAPRLSGRYLPVTFDAQLLEDSVSLDFSGSNKLALNIPGSPAVPLRYIVTGNRLECVTMKSSQFMVLIYHVEDGNLYPDEGGVWNGSLRYFHKMK